MKRMLSFYLSFLTVFSFSACDSLYLKVKGPVPGCVEINDDWVSSFVGELEKFTVLGDYSLMRRNEKNITRSIKGFYSGTTSATLIPKRVSFSFNNKKYYLCRDVGFFSTEKELSIIKYVGDEKEEASLKAPRLIADACVFELVLNNSRFLVVFGMLTPKSHNCKLWILDEMFKVVYDETLSNVFHPRVVLIEQGFAIKTSCDAYKVYKRI